MNRAGITKLVAAWPVSARVLPTRGRSCQSHGFCAWQRAEPPGDDIPHMRQLREAYSMHAVNTLEFDPMRQVVISRGESGYWIAECPSLPGCVSQGLTREEAIRNIKAAIALYIETLKDDGLAVPDDTFETTVIAV